MAGHPGQHPHTDWSAAQVYSKTVLSFGDFVATFISTYSVGVRTDRQVCRTNVLPLFRGILEET